MKTISRTFSINKKQIKKYFNTYKEADIWINEMRENHSEQSLPNEEWKKIPNYSRYEASNFGRLRSLNYKKSGTIKILKSAITKDGYLQTMLKNDSGKYNSKKVHWFVTLSWFGFRAKDKQVNHIDGNKQNNSIHNLEYVTQSENSKHSFRIGLQKARRGELNGMSKLTKEEVIFLRNEKKTKGRFWGRNEYAKQYGISAKHLQKIVNDKTRTSWAV